MEDESELPTAPPLDSNKFLNPNLSRPINHPDSIHLSRSFYTNSTFSSSSTNSTSTSPPELVRHVQAAFKRQRNAAIQGIMQQQQQFNSIRPRRYLVPQQTTPKETNTKPPSIVAVRNKLNNDENMSKIPEKQVDASITAPTGWGSTEYSHEENCKPFTGKNDAGGQVQKKVHFAAESNFIARGDNERITRVDDDMLSHMDSLALTETECVAGHQVDASDVMNQEWQHHNFQSMEMDNNLRLSVGGMLAGKQIGNNQDQLEQFDNFLRNDLNNGMTQSSLVGSSCVTSTLINQSSAPMVSSTTYCSLPRTSEPNMDTEPAELAEVKQDIVDPSYSLPTNAATSMDVHKLSSPAKGSQSRLRQESGISKAFSSEDNNMRKGNVTDIKCNPSSSNVPLSDATLENSKSGKPEKGASDKAASMPRKRGYDPDSFFKVNGKLYQRLGKIGSGGSSEVHKVISSDCKIYALKKIKLKGRDYATAFGFCQEIEYLNRLKGMDNIIQLIDYEVTDKRLHQEVLNGTMSNKDGRVRDDGYIYMVLEYGEIDLAHMLSHKWKELDGSNTTIDENWLRFYWQQILLAVNTIHEERIVHSDLKPANFLLVRGALKLIDFGIAKAIMSDTTNIQRDSQVGTLSYMSPEAFMCNETDANGNTIKCGRPSDIWSLGCILYQMVYGRTPFSEYKTFWAKFKVITNPNHEIVYEPVSNPWLLDLMKKCLAWDRNERWRIPQLLQHPFLVPPIPPQLPEQSCNLFQLIAEFGKTDQKTLVLCSQIQNMIKDPKPAVQLDSSMTREQMRKVLCKISNMCFQLQEQLANIGTEPSDR